MKTKISLNVSKDLEITDSANNLRAKFNKQLADNENALASIIKEATAVELELLQREQDALASMCTSEISSFYKDVHTMLAPTGPPWEDAIASQTGQTSMAVTDFLNAKAMFYTGLTQLRYDMALEQVIINRTKAAKEAKRASAMELDSETPMATSVQELVRQRIQKEIGPLKKQVAHLKVALNDSAGRPRGTDRRKKTATPQQQKKKQNAKGKADAFGADKSGKRNAKSKLGSNAKQKNAKNAKGKTQSK